MINRLLWPRRLAASAALVCFLGAALPAALPTARDRVRDAVGHRAEPEVQARRRCLGGSYIDRVELLRQALGPEEPYLLAEGGDPELGGALWVRYELAPRPAVFLGRLARLLDSERLRRQRSRTIRRAVIAFGPRLPPLLWGRFQLLQQVERQERAAGARR